MTTSLERYTERHHLAFDLIVAGVLFGFVILGAALGTPGTAHPRTLLPALILGGVSCAALVGCRNHPRTAVAVTAVCVSAASTLSWVRRVECRSRCVGRGGGAGPPGAVEVLFGRR